MAQHLKGGLPRLDKVQPGVTPQIASVVARCLRRDPDDRYADMHALIHDLDNLDQVDTAVLVEAAKPSFFSRFRRSPMMAPVGIAILLLLAIIALAFGVQALHK
jgi:hypothetical protein